MPEVLHLRSGLVGAIIQDGLDAFALGHAHDGLGRSKIDSYTPSVRVIA